MKIILRKQKSMLAATDDTSREVLAKIKDGQEVTAEIKRPRRIRHHRLFFAILKFVVEHTDLESIETAKSALKVATGEVDPIIDAMTGKTFFILRSIAWEAKGQDEFEDFFNRAVEVITTRWMPPGTTAESVRAEILKMADGPMMAGIEDHRR